MNKNILYTVIGIGVVGVVGYMIYKKRKKSDNEISSKKMIEEDDSEEIEEEVTEKIESKPTSSTGIESKPTSSTGMQLKSIGGIKKIAVSRKTKRKPVQTTSVQYYPAKNRACKDKCNLLHPIKEDKRNNCKKECDKKYPIAPKSSFDGDGINNFEPISNFIEFEPFN